MKRFLLSFVLLSVLSSSVVYAYADEETDLFRRGVSVMKEDPAHAAWLLRWLVDNYPQTRHRDLALFWLSYLSLKEHKGRDATGYLAAMKLRGAPADFPQDVDPLGNLPPVMVATARSAGTAPPATTAAPAVKPAGARTFEVVLAESPVPAILKKVARKAESAGFSCRISPKSTKSVRMMRVLAGDYANAQEATAALNRLKHDGVASAFILREGDRYRLYAGSFADDAAARRTAERLAEWGVKADLRASMVDMPAATLSAGPFKDERKAQEAVARLKSVGIDARVVAGDSAAKKR